jgi:hypothetical protein
MAKGQLHLNTQTSYVVKWSIHKLLMLIMQCVKYTQTAFSTGVFPTRLCDKAFIKK